MKDLIANLFELWGSCYFGNFSKYMYKADLYGEVALWMVLIPLVVFFVYYKLLDHIRLAKTGIWAIILVVVSLFTAFIAWNIADAGIGDYLIQHKIKKHNILPVDYFWFSFIVFIYTAIISFLFSIVFKLGASRVRDIPF
ncbi:MAG: hypothetical protein IKI83_01420 [Prevotella sp.]|nr:hypothetical protein [Prevotella sp.]